VSETFFLLVISLLSAAVGFLIFKAAEPVYRLLIRPANRWDDAGFIRPSKWRREDNPNLFALGVGGYRAGVIFAWCWLKLVGIIFMFMPVIIFSKEWLK